MKAISGFSENVEIEEKNGLSYQKFAPLERFSFLKYGFILGYRDRTKINPPDIPKLISIVSGIPEEKFKVVIPAQVHQAEVKIFSENGSVGKGKVEEKSKSLERDALLTDQENLFLVVQVADCLPVFLVDGKNKLLGLAHIGWRGALLGMAEKFINKAFYIFESDLKKLNLVLGPSIGKCCYKISDSLSVLVDDKYVERRGAEKYLDLNSLVKDRFLKSGVREENIFVSKDCTFCGNRLYQSYRRDKEKAGRMIAFIGKVKEFKK